MYTITKMKFHFTPSGMAGTKKNKTSIGKDVKKSEASLTAGVKAPRCIRLGKPDAKII